jgi:16S rRNA G527 N7-methylase RsmG
MVADATVDRFEAYYRLLNHWNKKINLTALRLESLSDHAIDRILVEPLVAAEAVSRSSIEWWDLGSGGGSPAIPIKIVRSQA